MVRPKYSRELCVLLLRVIVLFIYMIILFFIIGYSAMRYYRIINQYFEFHFCDTSDFSTAIQLSKA